LCCGSIFRVKLLQLRQELLGTTETDHCIARSYWHSGHTILAGNNHHNHHLNSRPEKGLEVVAAVVSEQVEPHREHRTDHCIARNCRHSRHRILAGNNHHNHLDSTSEQGVEVVVVVVSEQVEQAQR